MIHFVGLLKKKIKNIVIFYSFYKESFNVSNEHIEKFKLKLYKFKIFLKYLVSVLNFIVRMVKYSKSLKENPL